VAGFAFYELFYNVGTGVWSTIQRGIVAADANPVTIHANGDAGNQLWITSGGVGYVFDLLTNTLTVEGVPGTTVTMGSFLDARFLYLDADTGAFYASALYDGTSWNPTMVAQSESGDPWRALIVTPDDLIRLLGETTGEVWANQGTLPFPFSQIREASSPFGIVAPFAWAVDTAISWVAQNAQGRPLIVRCPGYTPERISTHAIETALSQYTDLDLTIAFAYSERGHSYSVFTFPTGNETWCYDQSIQLWHQRAIWDPVNAVWNAYRPGCQMMAFGKQIVGDRLTGSLYEMSSAFHTDVTDGGVESVTYIRRMRQAPRLSADQRRITIHSLQLVLDAGEGLNLGQGSNPLVMLEIAKDGGKVFGNQRMESAGAIGAFDTRVRWTRCGQGRNPVPRFTVSDPIPWRVVDLLVDYSVGAH